MSAKNEGLAKMLEQSLKPARRRRMPVDKSKPAAKVKTPIPEGATRIRQLSATQQVIDGQVFDIVRRGRHLRTVMVGWYDQ